MITSLTNEKVKELIKLNKSKYRNEMNLFLVEGDHLVKEAKELNLLVEVYTILDDYDGIKVSEQVMKKICSTNTVCPVIGVVKKINKKEISNKVLILDRVSDPGNLGTLLRSAKAFGFNTVFCSEGCVDYYNDKVIRSSQGAIFKLNLLNGNIIEFINRLKDTHDVYGTNVENGISLNEVTKSDNFALVLGNEGSGISDEVFAVLNKNIYIEMEDTESLNVGVCGSIIMHYIK
ncbi:MAG: RNA methyltransferase [bacterium]